MFAPARMFGASQVGFKMKWRVAPPRGELRLAAGRDEEPTAAVLDSRTLRSSPESGARAGYDGAKRKKGSKLHMAVDTLGHLLAAHVTPATADDRAEVGRLDRKSTRLNSSH